MLVSLIQASKEERESREKAKRERLLAQWIDKMKRLAAKKDAVLIEWERTFLPPQSEEV